MVTGAHGLCLFGDERRKGEGQGGLRREDTCCED